MTKEITKAIILQEIQDKFKLRELSPEVFRFSEEVVPVYEIGGHLKTWGVLTKTVSIGSATNYLFFTVPQTEKWLLRGFQVIYGMTGAIKGTGLNIGARPSGSPAFFLDMTKGQEVSYVLNLPVPVVLDPGNTLSYMIDTYVSVQNLTVTIDVQKEILR